MAMFGALPRTATLFAQPGYGAPQSAPQPTQGEPQYQPFAPIGGIAPNYKPSISEKLAAISGIFSQLGGVQNDAFSQYQQNLQQHRLMQQKAQMEQAKLYQPQDVGGSLVRLNPQTGKYEAVYTPDPKPASMPEIVQLATIANDASQPDYARNAARDRIAAMNDPVVTMPGGGMALRSTVTGMLGASGAPNGGPPPSAVAYLKANPSLAGDFDAKYGQGASARILQGGVAPQAQSPFPRQ